jgi:AcrR family transcriptional regulator
MFIKQLLKTSDEGAVGSMAKAGPRAAGQSKGRAPETRAALVAAAVSALGEVGFAGASAREIAGRAGCNQALVFYHFGSVTDLLLAGLDDVSARRLAAYTAIVEQAESLTELIDSARAIFSEDLDSGHVTVLVEMITGAQAIPGLGEQVSARLAPWREFAESAVRKGMRGSPFASFLPSKELAHGVVAGLLGLELLAHLDNDRDAALALFDRARSVAGLLELTAGMFPASEPEGDQP